MISALMFGRVYLWLWLDDKWLVVLSSITDLLQLLKQEKMDKFHAWVKQYCLIPSALALEIWSLIKIQMTQNTLIQENDWLTDNFSGTCSNYRNLCFFVRTGKLFMIFISNKFHVFVATQIIYKK